jgi:hypothetical protein
MKKFFNMKMVAIVVACFALSAVFSSCQKSDEKQITEFRFKSPLAVGVINQDAKTVTVAMPEGTDVTKLAPVIIVSSLATVDPASGVAQNFTNPVNYTVKAENGTTAVYKVTVTVGTAGQSDAKQITGFQFQSPLAVGVIDENAKTIAVDMPYGTDVTALAPVITVSSLATVNPASGVSQNFTNPVNYTVTAENGTTAVYTATVTVANPTEPIKLISPINQNTTLKDLGLDVDYVFEEGNILLKVENNATLTIEPGVTIQFKNDKSGISIAAGSQIVADGTEEKPIKFIGNSTNSGSWAYINISSNKANSFKYCHFIGGGNFWNQGVINCATADSKLLMEYCHINGSDGRGFYTESTNTSTINETIIENCKGEGGIYMNAENAKLSLTNVTIRNNTQYGVYFSKNGEITHQGVNDKFLNNAIRNVRLSDGTGADELP